VDGEELASDRVKIYLLITEALKSFLGSLVKYPSILLYERGMINEFFPFRKGESGGICRNF
jgi:hypothetical protein